MGQSIPLEQGYYAHQAHSQAPWLIRNAEHRVVGHYTIAGGASWGMVMPEPDKARLLELLQQRIK